MEPQGPGETRRHVDWGAVVFGLIVVALGIYFVLKVTLKIDVPEISWDMIWPLALIAVGAAVLLGALTGSSRRKRP